MMAQFEKRACRPRDHLVAAAKLYPDAWKQSDEFRSDRGTQGLPAWPDWCYLPMAAWYAIVSAELRSQSLNINTVGDVGRLSALGAWRCTQGIYRFDPALYEAVRDTPIEGDLPCDVLYRLPEWCVYIEAPDMLWHNKKLHGFFAHLEWDAGTQRTELRLLIDSDAVLQPIPVHLGNWTLKEAIAQTKDAASVQALIHGIALPPKHAAEEQAYLHSVEPLISLLLYLCSQAAEIGNGKRRPANPEPKRTKHGWRMFPAERVETWEVGVRIGSALRAAYHASEVGEGTHAGPCPHIRRSHWHGYWNGPRNTPEERKFALKWMPPIPVNVTPDTDLAAVIRPVKGN